MGLHLETLRETSKKWQRFKIVSKVIESAHIYERANQEIRFGSAVRPNERKI